MPPGPRAALTRSMMVYRYAGSSHSDSVAVPSKVDIQRRMEPPVSSVVDAVSRYVPAEQRAQLRRYARSVRRRVNPPRVNPLEEYFRSNDERLIHKWTHYFDIYDRHFAPYRGKPVKILEFGV